MQRIHMVGAPHVWRIVTRTVLVLLCAAVLAAAQNSSRVAHAAPTSAWTQVGRLNAGRFGLAAAVTVGPFGSIYAIGGGSPTGTPLTSVETYNAGTNSWSFVTPMPTARVSLAAALGDDGRIYAIGGLAYSGIYGNALNTVEDYDQITNTWGERAPLATARYNLVAAAGLDGRIYALGGLGTGGTPVTTVEAYDPTPNSWTTVGSLPAGLFPQAAATGPDGLIYVIGGSNGSGTGNMVEAYDPIANTWTPIASTPSLHTNLAATTGADGKIYAVGGYGTNSSAPSKVEAYDTSTKTWMSVASLPSTRWDLAAATGPNGVIYAIGGYDSADNQANSVQALSAVVSDTTPPTTAASATAGANQYSFGNWTNQNVLITLTASDNTGGSGVKHTYYAVDASGCAPTAVTGCSTYSGPFSISAEGDHTLTYFSIDNAGNAEAAHSASVRIDMTPPTVTFTGNASPYTVDQTVSITCTAADNPGGSGLASNTCQQISAPAYTYPLGTTKVSASATDMAGNVGTSSTDITVQVTYGSQCTLTTSFIEGSARYQALPPTVRAQIARLAAQICRQLSSAQYAPTPTQKAQLIRTYQAIIQALVAPGWLTQNQATLLTTLSNGL